MTHAVSLPDGSFLDDFESEDDAREYASHWLWLQGLPGQKIAICKLQDWDGSLVWEQIGVECA